MPADSTATQALIADEDTEPEDEAEPRASAATADAASPAAHRQQRRAVLERLEEEHPLIAGLKVSDTAWAAVPFFSAFQDSEGHVAPIHGPPLCAPDVTYD